MAKDIEPLDDDALDTVTGGTNINDPNECNSYSWNGDAGGRCCATCVWLNTPLCSGNNN